MTLDRRSFLGAVPIASLGLAAGSSAWAQYGAAPSAAPAAAPAADMDSLGLLCGENRHALVPLAPGKAAPTLEEIGAAIERAEAGPRARA